MGIVTGISQHVDIPHEPGESMELRKLTWRQLDAASDAASGAALKRLKGYGPEVIQALRSLGNEQQKKPEAEYDRRAVLCAGIAAWSYDVPVTPENIDLLDEATAKWAFDEILSANKPRSEQEQKNA